MASKRFDEFIKNASPEMKARIADMGKEALTQDGPKAPEGIKVNQPSEYRDQSPDRRAEQARPYAAAPEPSYNTTNQQPAERRIDRAMIEKDSNSVEQSKGPEKSVPDKEPER